MRRSRISTSGTDSLLKDHADAHANLDRIHIGAEEIRPVRIQDDLPLVPVTRIQIVHAVQTAQERRLAASGWSNERSNFFS